MDRDALARESLAGLSTFYGYYVLQARAAAGDHAGCLDVIRRFWAGVSAGLGGSPPGRWAGVAVYAEWTLRPDDEAALRRCGVGATTR